MQDKVKSGRERVTWPFLEYLVPLHISGTDEAKYFKFGMQICH